MNIDFLEQLPVVDTTGKHIYIWGTGNTSVLYQEGFAREEWLEIYGYAVNDMSQIGKEFRGKRIYSAEEVARDKKAIVLICSAQPQVYQQLKIQMYNLGIESYYIDAVIFEKNKEKIKSVIGMLEDQESINTYIHILECRIKCEYPDIGFVNNYPYTAIPAFRMIDGNDVFVDCGAFVGDTIEKFIWDHFGTFKRIIGIEPDPNNYKAMSIRSKRLREEWALRDDMIKLYPYGVSDTAMVSHVGKSSSGNLGSFISGDNSGDSEDSVKIVSIDDLMQESYTFLKADIESWEYKMLIGAKESIKKWSPRLGICIYHNATDFYSIPLLVKEISPDYHLAVRHHVAQLAETVLYAWK